jgi:hypothetical protein
MNSDFIRRYEMLVRVRDFGAAHAKLFPASTRGGEAFATVAAAVEELSASAAARMSSKSSEREGAMSRSAAREALIADMSSIARTGRALAIDAPTLDAKFRVPRRANDVALLSTARTFARDAAPLKQEFIDHNMPADFLKRLASDIDQLEKAIGESTEARGTGVVAKTQIEQTLEAALTAVRRLDAIVANTLRDNAAEMALWETARRIEGRRSKNAAATETAPVIAGPAAAATAAATAGSSETHPAGA